MIFSEQDQNMAKNDTLSGFIVRQAEPRDEGAIKEICRISFDRFYSYFASRSLQASDQVLLSENSESVVGFAALKSVHIGNHVVGNILWLAVHPEHRLKGVASGLLDSSTAYFGIHGMDHVYVSVRKENSVALRFFERKGFRKLDFRGLLRLYGRRVLEVYSKMRIPPGEIVLATTIQSGQNCQQRRVVRAEFSPFSSRRTAGRIGCPSFSSAGSPPIVGLLVCACIED